MVKASSSRNWKEFLNELEARVYQLVLQPTPLVQDGYWEKPGVPFTTWHPSSLLPGWEAKDIPRTWEE